MGMFSQASGARGVSHAIGVSRAASGPVLKRSSKRGHSCPVSPVTRMRVARIKKIGKHVLVLAVYEGVKHYEGRKVLCYLNTSRKWVRQQNWLDPHFAEGSTLFARFEPPGYGWRQAKKMLRRI